MKSVTIPLESVAAELVYSADRIRNVALKQKAYAANNYALPATSAIKNFSSRIVALAALFALAIDENVNVPDSKLLHIYLGASNTGEYADVMRRTKNENVPMYIVYNNKKILKFEWDTKI